MQVDCSDLSVVLPGKTPVPTQSHRTSLLTDDGMGTVAAHNDPVAMKVKTECTIKSQPFTGALPILQSAASSKEAHPRWHDYFEKVYHEPVPSATTVDLNTFEWFYWFAPGADSVVPLVANFWSGDRE